MVPARSIAIVEDDQDLAKLVRMHLSDCGFGAECYADGSEALGHLLEGRHDLVVLDVMLPGMDGFAICRRLRESGSRVPVLMLTSRSEEVDRVLGLEIGADDYLTKPFSVRELQARVRALLRRADLSAGDEPSRDEQLSFGELTIIPDKRCVTLRGTPLDLTVKEFDLLLLFARNPGKAYNRQELLDQVWGYQYDGYSHTVNTHINRLRNKLGDDPTDPRFIKTVWGHGYSFVELESAAP